MNTHRRGARGEALAAQYLVENGYRLLAQNFRTDAGEVDIVCEKDLTVVFVEVKAWRSLPTEELGRIIGERKQRRISEVARSFIALDSRYESFLKRFDVILIRPDEGSVIHIEGAFDEACQE